MTKKKHMTIWCIFSVENDYNQPLNNLVTWFKQRPDFCKIKKTIGQGSDTEIGRVLKGEEVRISNTDFLLEEVEEEDIL